MFIFIVRLRGALYFIYLPFTHHKVQHLVHLCLQDVQKTHLNWFKVIILVTIPFFPPLLVLGRSGASEGSVVLENFVNFCLTWNKKHNSLTVATSRQHVLDPVKLGRKVVSLFIVSALQVSNQAFVGCSGQTSFVDLKGLARNRRLVGK